MNVLGLMAEDGAEILQHIHETSKNYYNWSMDHVFANAKEDLNAIQQYFERERVLEKYAKKDSSISRVLREAAKQRQELKTEMGNLVMIHVDETGFAQALDDISHKFERHRKFCEQSLFPNLRKIMSAKDLNEAGKEIREHYLA